MDTVDWRRIINDLKRVGMTLEQQAREVGVCRRTIIHWREEEHEPTYSRGAKLLSIYHTVYRSD